MSTSTRSKKVGSDGTTVPTPQFRWTTRLLLPALLLAAFAALFAGSVVDSLRRPVAVETVPVVEQPSILRTLDRGDNTTDTVVAQAAGWLEPDPYSVYASALTDGTVAEVAFLEGDYVTHGDILVRLVDDDARLDLVRAEAEARAAEETWATNVEAARAVAVAEAGLREARAALELARSDLEVERAQLRDAQRVHTRREGLLARGLLSQEDYDTAQAIWQAQTHRVRSAERRITEMQARAARDETDFNAARRHLELRTEDRLRLDRARVALAEARLRMERQVIRAPMNGAVIERLVEPGGMVAAVSDNPALARIAELYDPQHLQVRVDVPLADVATIQVGQRAEVVVEVLPDSSFSGKVTRITHLADIQKNTLEVKVALEAPARELKPDMLARVRFYAVTDAAGEAEAEAGNSVFAPASAIRDGATWVVTQHDGDTGLAERRTVTLTGAEREGWQEVDSGLQPGDLLIVNSTNALEPGRRVRLSRGANE